MERCFFKNSSRRFSGCGPRCHSGPSSPAVPRRGNRIYTWDRFRLSAHQLVPLVSMDALEVSRGGKHTIAVNMVISGVLPDRGRWWHRRRRLSVFVDGKIIFAGRATTVIAANGQFFHGLDLIPRGHPGDSCIEVQILALPVGQRRAFKRRLATGTHVPHPGVIEGRGRRIEVSWRGRRSLNIDGRDQDLKDSIVVDVRPNAYQLARRSTP